MLINFTTSLVFLLQHTFDIRVAVCFSYARNICWNTMGENRSAIRSIPFVPLCRIIRFLFVYLSLIRVLFVVTAHKILPHIIYISFVRNV